ncbi:MAG: inositol 2-dehydrogenase [Boseongicola sp. SB0664_bin_43]|uniref:Inositol 2-dehydrogenase n=1 Tax=Boseongicola sp. SB0664_bin_43 TaxID=2604844 RepID=A0A6B0XY92_9RHOB|nr:inositol 2-dehydrogenase [Boseongicola sp. SB0664_bin_43]
MAVRLAILGAGRIGRVHARAIAENLTAELVAVHDPVAAAADAIQSAYGCEIRTVGACAEADDIDAVLICTPTDLHAEQIELFARAGKAVFCEKPVDLSVKRVRACLDVVRDEGTTLMIGFNRRFDKDFKALKSVIAEGGIGNVEVVTITSRDPGPPPIDYIRRSGGIFRDMTIHDFDMARWLLDEEIDSVFAQGSVLVDPAIGEAGDLDSVNVLLKTESGRQCVISNSRRAAYGYDQRIEVLGSDGMASAQNVHETRVETATSDGYLRPPLQNFFMERYEAAYANEIGAFVHVVETGTAPPVSGHDGLMALVLAEAANVSVAESRAVAIEEVLG